MFQIDCLNNLQNNYIIESLGTFNLQQPSDRSMLNIDMPLKEHYKYIGFSLVPSSSLAHVRSYYNHKRGILYLNAIADQPVEVFAIYIKVY